MATGVPKKKAGKPVAKAEVSLVYPGKKSEKEIFSFAPGIFNIIRKFTNDSGNMLYFGENLSALSHMYYQRDLAGKIKLIYIDPPFATQTVFHSRKLEHAYEDLFDGAQYIEFIRERILFLYKLLADDGSIYVHIDAKMLFHVKIIMDEIFGPQNFRNCITRKKSNPKNYTNKRFGNISDYILFYSKDREYTWNRQFESWTDERAREYQYVEPDTGRRFMKVPVHAPGIRNGETGLPWRGVLPPPGKHWQFPPSVLDELDKRGKIYWSKNGNPRRKVYLDENPGVPVQDIWLDYRDAHNQMVHVTGYPTEKNINLLRRIILASSNPGDIVLDCFCGSGTTLVAADMLGRHWIGVDNSPEALRTMMHRFRHGTMPMGDFVGKQTPKRKGAEAPTLKGLDLPDEPHFHRVERFALYATPETAAQAEAVIASLDPPDALAS